MKNQPKVAKKLWKLLQIVLYMTKIRTIGKSKVILDLQTLLKRTKSNLIDSSYYSALTCRSNDGNMSFISPREYEFSCSNTPAHKNRKSHNNQYYYRAEDQVNAVQKVLEMLNRNDANIEASPLNLPGFGCSPYAVRQLRVTDSPFATEVGSSCQVDKECEEFINKFYKSLKKERRIAALDQSPSPCHLWAR